MPRINFHLCSIEGCERDVRARGWCIMHWKHWRKWGDPLAGEWRPNNHVDPVTRFWLKVDKTDTCWLWTAGVNKNGYGRIRVNGQTVLAHRYAYKLLTGAVFPELDHNCHNRRCIRPHPKHVRPATHKQNLENQRGPTSRSTSGIRGVTWRKDLEKWSASASHHNRKYYFGFFLNIAEAEAAAIAGRNNLYTHNDLDRINV